MKLLYKVHWSAFSLHNLCELEEFMEILIRKLHANANFFDLFVFHFRVSSGDNKSSIAWRNDKSIQILSPSCGKKLILN